MRSSGMPKDDGSAVRGMPGHRPWFTSTMPTSFSVTWDYRCPFARIAHEHVVEGLLDGADWDVTFVPFSLGQVHVEEGEPDIWETPELDTGLLGPAGRRGRARRLPRPVPRRAPGLVHRPPRRRGPAPRARGRAPGADRRRASTPTPCSPRSPPAPHSRPSARSTRRPRPTTTSGACPPSSPATRASFVRLMEPPDGDAGPGPAHRRAHRRPADRVARAQRVQAHQPQPLSPRAAPSPAALPWRAWAPPAARPEPESTARWRAPRRARAARRPAHVRPRGPALERRQGPVPQLELRQRHAARASSPDLPTGSAAACCRRCRRIPRLHQRVVPALGRMAPPEWQDDPDFDIDRHVRHVALPQPGHRAPAVRPGRAVRAGPARPHPTAVGVRARRRAAGRPGRPGAEDAPHDHRRRGGHPPVGAVHRRGPRRPRRRRRSTIVVRAGAPGLARSAPPPRRSPTAGAARSASPSAPSGSSSTPSAPHPARRDGSPTRSRPAARCCASSP